MSTAAIERNLRTRLLTFTRLTGESLADILGRADRGAGIDGKLYRGRVDDGVTGLYGEMCLKNRRRDMENPQAELADLEVQYFARNWSNRPAINEAADASDEAMCNYRSVTDEAGVIAVWYARRSDIGPMKDPADSDMVTMMCMYGLRLWPKNLIQYADVNV